jgi:hypothetical protein
VISFLCSEVLFADRDTSALCILHVHAIQPLYLITLATIYLDSISLGHKPPTMIPAQEPSPKQDIGACPKSFSGKLSSYVINLINPSGSYPADFDITDEEVKNVKQTVRTDYGSTYSSLVDKKAIIKKMKALYNKSILTEEQVNAGKAERKQKKEQSEVRKKQKTDENVEALRVIQARNDLYMVDVTAAEDLESSLVQFYQDSARGDSHILNII